jgi:hypothetical protein
VGKPPRHIITKIGEEGLAVERHIILKTPPVVSVPRPRKIGKNNKERV